MIRYISTLLSQTYEEWSQHDAATLGAALAYYTVLSVAPLLVIAVAIAGMAFRTETVQNQIVTQVSGLMGQAGADAFRAILVSAKSPQGGAIASAIAIVVLLSGASGVFSQLRKALNRIWDVPEIPSSGIGGMLKEHLFSFSVVVGVGFLLIVSLLLTTFLSALGKFAGGYVPAALLQVFNILFSLIGMTLMFALIYRFIPQQTLPWNHLWPGSLATAILFTAGKELLGVYLGKASVGSAYGAAGSLVVFLVWVYYSSQLFLFGAEFTHVLACRKRTGSNRASEA